MNIIKRWLTEPGLTQEDIVNELGEYLDQFRDEDGNLYLTAEKITTETLYVDNPNFGTTIL